MDQWNLTQTLSNAAEVVTVMLAGSQMRTEMWSSLLAADSRFRITTIAYTPDDLKVKLASQPEIILLDSTIFASPEALFSLLTRISQSAVYLVLPAGLQGLDLQSVQATLQGMPVVRGSDASAGSRGFSAERPPASIAESASHASQIVATASLPRCGAASRSSLAR